MKLKVDENICKKHGLSEVEFLVMISILASQDTSYAGVISSLKKKGIISCKENTEDYFITQPWADVITEIICDSSGAIDDEERLMNLAKSMRECYPEGKMPGTAYYYRCNNREVFLKLKKFFLQYGNYSDDKIIDATKRFVASFQGNYRYLPLIKYFISKNKTVEDEDGKIHIQEVSELASYLENKEVEQRYGEDWMMNSKN